MKTFKSIVLCVIAAVAIGSAALAAEGKSAAGVTGRSHKSPTTHPSQRGGLVPDFIDRTIQAQNSPADKLRIDITHSFPKDGKYEAYVRIVWGDLDNVIKDGGRQYYSNWDGQLMLASGTAVVERTIAFESHNAIKSPPPSKEKERKAVGSLGHAGARGGSKAMSASHPSHSGPGDGSGADDLVTREGKEIVWKAGVVGALDGLLIKITSDTPTPSGTIKVGKFSESFSITPKAAPTKASHSGREKTGEHKNAAK